MHQQKPTTNFRPWPSLKKDYRSLSIHTILSKFPIHVSARLLIVHSTDCAWTQLLAFMFETIEMSLFMPFYCIWTHCNGVIEENYNVMGLTAERKSRQFCILELQSYIMILLLIQQPRNWASDRDVSGKSEGNLLYYLSAITLLEILIYLNIVTISKYGMWPKCMLLYAACPYIPKNCACSKTPNSTQTSIQ